MTDQKDTPAKAETKTAAKAETKAGSDAMRTAAPDRLSNNPGSDFFDADKLQRGIGISFKGNQRHDVEEYCVSEGWVKVAAGKSRDRYGQPMTIKLSGPVEAWYETGDDDGE